MRRHQFETYLDKVFGWTASVATMAEGRQNPPHPWPKVFDAVFLGSACQFGPVHRIEAECKDGVLHSNWARGRMVAAVDGIEQAEGVDAVLPPPLCRYAGEHAVSGLLGSPISRIRRN
ncbi:MAG: hypothetical protein AAB225_14105 [Acidobacteriota bacterium]